MEKQRGLTEEQIRYIKSDQRLKNLIEGKKPINEKGLIDEGRLFLGIRGNCFNLYFRGSSVGKFEWSRGVLRVETHLKYLPRDYVAEKHWKVKKDGKQYRSIPLDDFLERYTEIIGNIKQVQESDSSWREKNAQQALILANNRNPESAWYCVDMEYAQARKSGGDPNYGRCDIIAVRKQPDGKGRHQVALIELKVGCGSYSSEFPEKERERLQEQIKSGTFSISKYDGSLGSGIVGHLADFCRFEQRGRFEKLKEEVCAILANKRDLGFAVPWQQLCPRDLAERPQFYFLTLYLEKREKSRKDSLGSCKTSMLNYLGAEGQDGLAAYNAQRVLNSTFRDRDNYHFLFAPLKMSERDMVDILEEKDIVPL